MRLSKQSWGKLRSDERARALAWVSFTTTFAVTRCITHWIKSGHGPKSGGMSVGGRHFHHYNLGIALLSGIGALTMAPGRRDWDGPGGPILYGIANALIADEAALLLDLQDVYWSKQGRLSVDVAVTLIGAGGAALAAVPVLQALRRVGD